MTALRSALSAMPALRLVPGPKWELVYFQPPGEAADALAVTGPKYKAGLKLLSLVPAGNGPKGMTDCVRWNHPELRKLELEPVADWLDERLRREASLGVDNSVPFLPIPNEAAAALLTSVVGELMERISEALVGT